MCVQISSFGTRKRVRGGIGQGTCDRDKRKDWDGDKDRNRIEGSG